MDFLSPLGSYGLRRFLDVVANILLRFGLQYLDRLMDGGQESRVGSEVVTVPMEDGDGSVVFVYNMRIRIARVSQRA